MHLRIVIFGNDADALDALKFSLSSRGYEVLCYSEPYMCPGYTGCSTGCFQQDPCVDILLVLNRMKRMTGLELIRQQARKGCKILAMNKAVISGDFSSENLQEAEKLGCKTLFKPLDLNELFRWLEERACKIDPARKLALIKEP